VNVYATLTLAFVLTGDAQVVTNGSEDTHFRFEASQCDGSFHSEWRSREGRVVAEEELVFKDQLWFRYHLQRWTIKQDVLAIRENETVRLVIVNGTTTRQVTLRPEKKTLVGPQLVDYLGAQLQRLRKGAAVEFSYLIPEHALVLSLRALVDRSSRPNETVVRVEATSMLMRAFVPKTVLAYDNAGLLKSMTGRLLPQIGDQKNPVALDGIIRIERIEPGCR
jgi:hypothetical protein